MGSLIGYTLGLYDRNLLCDFYVSLYGTKYGMLEFSFLVERLGLYNETSLFSSNGLIDGTRESIIKWSILGVPLIVRDMASTHARESHILCPGT